MGKFLLEIKKCLGLMMYRSHLIYRKLGMSRSYYDSFRRKKKKKNIAFFLQENIFRIILNEQYDL